MESALTAIGTAPVITALVQLVKPFVKRDDWFGPLALLFGVLTNVGAGLATGGNVAESFAAGVLAGLAASGLYSTGKAMGEAK
jgi:hypothetical protein